jgi:hypothetical protein
MQYPARRGPRPCQERSGSAIGEHHFEIIHYDPETAARPDWIWLPNALIDGADGNVAAPVELVRHMTQRHCGC